MMGEVLSWLTDAALRNITSYLRKEISRAKFRDVKAELNRLFEVLEGGR